MHFLFFFNYFEENVSNCEICILYAPNTFKPSHNFSCMTFSPILLQGFDGRERALEQIKRYVHHITPVMFYRTNDLIHSRRVLWHLEDAVPDIVSVYEKKFNIDFARTLAKVHDDVEILSGDVQLVDKETMGAVELEELSRKEKMFIPRIVEMYNSIANGFDYAELLASAKMKDCLEAQFVSFFDKFDGFGESLHEIFAGNYHFLLPAGGNDGQRGGYVRRLNEFPTKYPTMKDFFQQFSHYLPTPFDFKTAAKQGTPHTKDSIIQEREYPPYERWKITIIKQEGIELLVTRVE